MPVRLLRRPHGGAQHRRRATNARSLLGPAAAACVASALALSLGCASPDSYREAADREVYALIDARRAAILERDPVDAFSIDPPEDSLRARTMRGDVQFVEPLRLVDCLRIAAEDNEQYRAAKESLYLAALDLTEERWRLSWNEDASANATVSGVGDESASASADAGATLSRVFAAGTSVVLDGGASLFRVVSTGDGWDVVSDLSLAVTQPLLRGAGRRVTLEQLTQAERDLVYEARSYDRFRRTFSVDVARRVYGLLQAFDELENEELNFDNLLALRERNERLAEAGQLSEIEADQARQDELRSENRLVALRADLERQIDDLKLFLGLPLDLEIGLDRGEFDRLRSEAEVLDLLDDEVAVAFALRWRLDVRTSADRVEDAERDVVLAVDALRPGLGVVVAASNESPEGRPLGNRLEDTNWSVGLDLDLPLDQVPERNAYRASLIRLESERRAHARFLDAVTADVRDVLRQARDARESFRIQQGAVELAERRVQSADLSLQAGRASTRDVLESQAALLEARNALTAALIDLNLALLDLHLTLETLRVDDDGIDVGVDLVEVLQDFDSQPEDSGGDTP